MNTTTCPKCGLIGIEFDEREEEDVEGQMIGYYRADCPNCQHYLDNEEVIAGIIDP